MKLIWLPEQDEGEICLGNVVSMEKIFLKVEGSAYKSYVRPAVLYVRKAIKNPNANFEGREITFEGNVWITTLRHCLDNAG